MSPRPVEEVHKVKRIFHNVLRWCLLLPVPVFIRMSRSDGRRLPEPQRGPRQRHPAAPAVPAFVIAARPLEESSSLTDVLARVVEVTNVTNFFNKIFF